MASTKQKGNNPLIDPPDGPDHAVRRPFAQWKIQ